MLSTFFVEKPGREPAAYAAGSLVRVRARQMECRKNLFQASQRTCWSWIFVTCFIIRAYHDVIKWKNAMKKLDFTPKNVVNCVDNEITARINYYHWLSFFGSIVLYVSTVSYLCLSLIYCLTHVEWSVSVSSTWPLSLRHLNCTPRLQYMQRLFRLCHLFCEK